MQFIPPVPVYREEPTTRPVAYARSSDRRFVFPAHSDLLSVPTTTDAPERATYYKLIHSPPHDLYIQPEEKAQVTPNPLTPISSEQESKIVEFRGCLMRDFEQVWVSPVAPGEAFVPRNEIESTCKSYIEKMEQLRNQCMEAMETLLIAKTKSAENKEPASKSWWRFLTFGRR